MRREVKQMIPNDLTKKSHELLNNELYTSTDSIKLELMQIPLPPHALLVSVILLGVKHTVQSSFLCSFLCSYFAHHDDRRTLFKAYFFTSTSCTITRGVRYTVNVSLLVFRSLPRLTDAIPSSSIYSYLAHRNQTRTLFKVAYPSFNNAIAYCMHLRPCRSAHAIRLKEACDPQVSWSLKTVHGQ